MQITDWHASHIVEGLSSYHWLMQSNPRDELVSCLTRFKPGTVLTDKEGHYWIRQAKMVITRHRFISSVGDDQEQYYQQKINIYSKYPSLMRMVLNPPESWIELCAREECVMPI